MLELFARIEDEERALSVILSDGQVTLEPADGPRLWFSRTAFDRLADLIRRYDAAIAAAGCGAGEAGSGAVCLPPCGGGGRKAAGGG